MFLFGLISCPPIPKFDFALCWLGLGNFLDLFRFRLLYHQLLSSSGMLVFLWRPLSICLLKVFLDIRGIIAWKWADFFGRTFLSMLKSKVISLDDHFLSLLRSEVISLDNHFLSLLKSEVIFLDDHFWSLRCFFFHSFSGCHVWYSWFVCDLHLCENPCLLTLI